MESLPVQRGEEEISKTTAWYSRGQEWEGGLQNPMLTPPVIASWASGARHFWEAKAMEGPVVQCTFQQRGAHHEPGQQDEVSPERQVGLSQL
jgi:hypothetical protein